MISGKVLFLLVAIAQLCGIFCAEEENGFEVVGEATGDFQNVNENVTGSSLLHSATVCDEDDPCRHGGTCFLGKCWCHPGTSGQFCEHLDCGDMCGNSTDDVQCVFNSTAGLPFCECRTPNARFDKENRICINCDCGPGEKSCKWSHDAKKICECKDMYIFDARDFRNECFNCKNWCNENAKTCAISKDGVVSCVCKKGYEVDPSNYQCKPCDCGPHGNCSYVFSFSKECACEEGYEGDFGANVVICKPCSCGVYATNCYIYNDVKSCRCQKSFSYNPESGECEKCDCGPDSGCYFPNGEKHCNCKQKQIVLNGTCQDCNCTFDGVDCKVENNSKICLCPDGYEDDDGACVDIDECLNPHACGRNKDCNNTIGSYNCTCKKGYQEFSGFKKEDDCVDINECLEPHACVGMYTQCYNTQGSYQCLCKTGYREEKIYLDPKPNSCYEDQTGWKIATITSAVLFGVAFIIIIYIIYIRRRRMRSSV